MTEETRSTSQHTGKAPQHFETATPGETPAQPAIDPWNLPDLGYFVAFLAAWFLLSQIFTLAGLLTLQVIFRSRAIAIAAQSKPFIALVAQTVFFAPVLAYIYHLVVVRFHLDFWSAFQWGRMTPERLVRFLLAGMLLALVLAHTPAILPDKDVFPLQELFTSSAAAYAIAGFAIVVAPFMEELIFRGVLFNFLERQAGRRFAVVASAVLFAGLHIPEYWGAWNRVLLVGIAGGVFSLARGLTGSLAPSVILHLGYNATLMTALFFETRRFQLLTPPMGG